MQAASFVVSFAVVSVLFALMFKWLPDGEVEWRDVWLGGVGTAALFEIGKYAEARTLLDQCRALCQAGGVPLGELGDERGFLAIGVPFDERFARVKVGEEDQAFGLVLHPHPAQDRAQQIAEVQVTGRLDSRNDAHHACSSLIAGLRRNSVLKSSRSIPPMNQAMPK